jgi:ssDNA-binding Zn-finger/Zn-ribbon topoisomerase 1
MTEKEVEKCPECGAEMEKGYIITQAIRWSKEKHTQWALGTELIVSWQLSAIPNVEAYRCTNCKLVLFHYQKSRFEETPKSFLKTCINCKQQIPIASELCPFCGQGQSKERDDVP